MDATERRVVVGATNEEAQAVFGRHDAHLKLIEASFPVRLVARGNEVYLSGPGEAVDRVAGLLEELARIVQGGTPLSEREIRYAIRMLKEGSDLSLAEIFSDVIVVTQRGRPLRPKSAGQKEYVEAIRRHGLTFGIGPAGTGKTYLAMAMAIAAYKAREVNRIILTRPAVEAGEKLGFLPGALEEKVNPYLRPLYDAIFDILGMEAYEKLRDRGHIEVAPLAYMRGRTLDDSFIILDEAQNTTPEQMKMFLTRLGFGSKAVVTGDITQVDLPPGARSGLVEVRHVLAGVPGIAFVYLTEKDVVRHELVQRIIAAYERYERQEPRRDEGQPAPRTARR
ncbi:PhoH family protein [Caldinitratiruptor microaerophilus]|uniref:PhoH-like protein n=1 Tax=Caldinitratiruptor microaerophilus TaxID=671077 RepID=A0AA35CN30_9FIRM|nr:PhoH family protein [Caldinitratiruptor microaerophilus]BDG61408.1 phosphate starvation protein PhoH [Caldinitratiruptor microaerophilus]